MKSDPKVIALGSGSPLFFFWYLLPLETRVVTLVELPAEIRLGEDGAERTMAQTRLFFRLDTNTLFVHVISIYDGHMFNSSDGTRIVLEMLRCIMLL